MAVFGAAAIAVAPIQPLSHQAAIVPQQISNLAVGLASSIDPITPWIDTIQNTADNIVGLFDAWASAPFPIVTQVINNQFTYLSELPNIGTIISQVIGNIGNAITAPFGVDLGTLDEPHNLAWTLLPQILDVPAALQPVLDFTTNFTTGILGGLVSPIIAPVLALGNSLMAAVNALVGADFLGAINEVINIPAHMVNAFLNGGEVLDLTGLMTAIGIVNPTPAPADLPALTGFGIAMGGLLSQGGSMFNTLQLVTEVFPTVDVTIPGVGAGAIGSLIGLTNAVANSIAVTPPNSAAAKAAAAKAAPAEATAASAAADAAAAPEAAAPEVSAADVAPQASAGDNSAPKPSGRASKAGRGADNGAAAGSDAPARSGKGGASRAA